MKIAIWGIGFCGKQFKRFCDNSNEYEIIVAFDNCVITQELWNGITTDTPENINNYEFEKIIVTPVDEKVNSSICNQIKELGISESKIIVLYKSDELIKKVRKVSSYDENDPRVSWLREYSHSVYENDICGDVAECGVNRGDFSMYINDYFSDRKLYLFDTFEGFSDKDLATERNFGDKAFIESKFNSDNIFCDSCVDEILERFTYPEKCEIRKGYFPETATGLENEKFCFVNLDMDLYNPQLEGLRFFYDKMVTGGIILLHDYFNEDLPGVKRAVDKFISEREEQIKLVKIDDNCSIAIIR